MLATEVFGDVGIFGIVVDEEHRVLVDGLGMEDLVGGNILGGLHLVDAVDDGDGLLEAQRTVVEHAVLVLEEAVEGVGELTGGVGAELGIAFGVLLDVFLTPYAVGVQGAESGTLVGLVVGTALDEALHKHLQGLVVGLAGGHDFLHEGHGFLHILGQAADAHSDVLVTHVDVIAAGQLIEFFLQLFGSVFVGIEIFHQVGGQVDGLVGGVAEIEAVLQVEGTVLHVLHIQHLAAVGSLAFLQVFLEVDKNGLDGFGLGSISLDAGQEGALGVATHIDGGNGGFLHLGHRVGGILVLVDDDVVVVLADAVGEVDDVFLRNLGKLVDFVADVAPVAVLYKGVGHLAGAAVVALGLLHDLKFQLIDAGLKETLVELALLHEVKLLKEQVAQLAEALSRGGAATEHEGGIVVESVGAGVGAEGFLLLVDVEVDETARAVVEYHLHGLGQQGVAASVTFFYAEGNGEVGRVLAVHEADDGRGNGILFHLGEWGNRTRHPAAEILVDNLDGLVGIEVARHSNAHIVGHIVGGMVFADVLHRGILQVLDGADSGLLAVGMVGEQGRHHRLVDAAVVLSHANVLLLVDGFQLGVEQTQHQVGEAVALHLGPGLELVGRDVLHVHRVVVRGEGVGALAADGRHRLVILVGDGDSRGHVADGVNLVVN